MSLHEVHNSHCFFIAVNVVYFENIFYLEEGAIEPEELPILADQMVNRDRKVMFSDKVEEHD